jgi:hypothetical protein
VSYKNQELLNILEHLDHPVFGGVRVAHLFCFLCCVFYVLLVVIVCFVCPMLSVSVDCLSVFSNVYIDFSFELTYRSIKMIITINSFIILVLR